MSALHIFQGGNLTFIISFNKTKSSCFTFPPMQHHSFFRNYRDINRNEQSCYEDEAGAFESVESSGGVVVRVLASHQCVPGLIP